jgi:hypothetical protein
MDVRRMSLTALAFLETCERRRRKKIQRGFRLPMPIYQAEQAGYFTCEKCGTELRNTFTRQLKHVKRCTGKFV